MSVSPSSLLRFSTAMLPERDRMAAFREEFARQVIKMDIVDQSGGKPRIDIAILRLGPVLAGSLVGSASEFIRDTHQVKDGVDDFQLLLVANGPVHGHQAGQDFSLDAGSAALFHYGQSYRCGGANGGRITNLTVPAAALRPLVPHPEDQVGVVVRQGPALRLLRGYLASLLALDEPPPVELGHLIGLHLLDLLAAVIGPRAEEREIIAERGLKAAHRRAVLAEIARRSGNPGLNIDGVAGRVGLSRRSVQRVLEETGRSFTEHLTERRLECAYAMLADPAFSHLKVIEIALAAGFSDVSHFNRVFRRRFGETPSSVRIVQPAPSPSDQTCQAEP